MSHAHGRQRKCRQVRRRFELELETLAEAEF